MLLLSVSACASVGASVSDCTFSATRLTEAEISALSDEAVNKILTDNEVIADQGCAVPNQ